MSAESTIHLIKMYVERATVVPFLTTFFQAPDENFHTTEKVELDVIRDTEEVAIVIQDLSAGTRENEMVLWQNKGFTPPIYDESASIHSYDLIRRQPGQEVYKDPDFNANATMYAFTIFRKLEQKIRRAIELMASQVLQTGKLTLLDASSRPMYSLDFGPKVTHFVTVGNAWNGGSADPIGDIGLLGEAVRRDGRGLPNKLIFGKRAWRDFFGNTAVRALFNMIRIDVGTIKPVMRTGGGSYKGTVTIDNYDYELYVYDGTYLDPISNTVKEYVGTDKVIMMSDNSRLDLTYGAIPLIRPPTAPALSFMPPRISDEATKLDLTTNAWFSPDGKHLHISAGTRPLTIPTAIDTFGCLTTR
jgi:hypothetical protein